MKKWIIALRAFSFTASAMSVVFGSIIAVVFGNAQFNISLFILSLLGMVLLHSGANVLSDVNDFKRGLDKIPTPVSGSIVRGLITPEQGKKFAFLLFLVGTIIGLIIAFKVGISILIIGGVGIIIGALYTTTPFALKYHRLGDLAVFLNFGTLGALGAWIVQTDTFSWLPIIWSIPLSLQVIAIVHANNWRDIESDKAGGIATFASLLGDNKSRIYYGLLIFGSFAIIIALVIISQILKLNNSMPWSFLIVLIALPKALNLWRKGTNRFTSKNPMDFVTLDGATAQFNLIFGLLCVGASLITYCLDIF